MPIGDEKDIPRDLYLRREVGVVLYDRVKNTFVGNVVYLECSWSKEYEDRWKFDPDKSTVVLYLDDKNELDLVIEMITYIKRGNTILELSCCHG